MGRRADEWNSDGFSLIFMNTLHGQVYAKVRYDLAERIDEAKS